MKTDASVKPVRIVRAPSGGFTPPAVMPPPVMGRFNHDEYVSMTMEFRCNLKCVHCMIEGTMERLAPQTFDQFKQLLEHNARTQQWKGLILTGSEITLHRDLPLWARMARDNG